MFVMNTLVPFSTYPVPLRRAVAWSEAASEPEAGSVSAKAPSSSPLASRGSQCFFCASSPNRRIGSVPTLVWTSTMTAVEAQAWASSSMQIAKASASRPAPPYSRGMSTPMSPASLTASTDASGKR